MLAAAQGIAWPPKRSRGRPRGAKNKPTLATLADTTLASELAALLVIAREASFPTITRRDIQAGRTRNKYMALVAEVRRLHEQGHPLAVAIDTVARDGAIFGDERYFASPASVRRAWRMFRDADFS